MPGNELFLSLAEIAGVFVGFGALIAVRSGSAAEAETITYIRWVLASGVWVVVAALAPIVVSQYGISGHELWFGCSLVALALYVGMMILVGMTPENRADVAITRATLPISRILLVMGSTFWLPSALLVLVLAVVILGLAPDQDRALYLTAVGLCLLQAALSLIVMALWTSPKPERDGAGQEAAGGSGA